MLRLRPSELTLTPEDVEETFRRIARRQAARHTSQATPHDGALIGRPVLRRGPQRAVRDAITSLGDIPILRPPPHQSEISCVDEDIETVPQPHTPAQTRQSITSETPSGQISRPPSTAASTLRRMHLPFRIGRHRRDSVTNPTSEEEDAQVEHNGTRNTSDHAATRIDGASDQARHRKTLSASRRRLSIRSPAELRGGGRPIPKREHSSKSSGEHHRQPPRIRRHHSSERTPPPPTIEVDSETSFLNNAPLGSLYLRGRPDLTGTRYTFDEFRLLPRSEPRPASRRRNVFTRSLSSGSAPRNGLHVSRTRPSIEAAEDPFSPVSSDMRRDERSRSQRRSLQPQTVGSEASDATDPFSIYELPSQSRNPSGGNSNSAMDSHNSTSMPATGGGYRSIYASSFDSRAQPYAHSLTRPNYNPHYGIPHNGLPFNVLQPGSTDAAMAAVLNLPSPLQPYSDHYQQLRFDYPRTSVPSTPPQPLLPESPQFLPSSVNANAAMTATAIGTTAAVTQEPSLYRSLVASYPRPQLDGATPTSPLQQQPTARVVQRLSENAPAVSTALPNGIRPRPGQVQLHRQAYERMHNAQQSMHQLSMQREAEDLLPPAPASDGIHSSTEPNIRAAAIAPHARPRHSGMLLSPMERVLRDGHQNPESRQVRDRARASSGSQHAEDVDSRTITPSDVRAREQRMTVTLQHRARVAMLRERPRAEDSSPGELPDFSRPWSAQRQVIDMNGQVSESVMPISSGSRPSAPARGRANARMQRRIPPEQRDQENSGVAEEQMMRDEIGAFDARYGEGGGATMDETPPRVGRVERRMRDGDLL